ncbi:MAG TPA: response regulator [Terriglobales bacterium]|nr:response regulator [Terriglobales bacterium]
MARKILLADDSVTAQNMGRKILTDAGYEVVTVNNGSAALKKIAECKPDLIVLDVYMPGYSGLEVCQRIKENKETARIPVLLTVGKLEPFKPEEARRARADAFVVKPFEASELLSALTKLEDKIVPQAEPYKQGRFAKAVASVDAEPEGEKFGDKDAGWKARLRIPTGKPKESEPSPDYAATQGKGFRDYVEPLSKSAPPVQPSATTMPERPLPAGLPHDITPEEIAAITAAAAQLSGVAAPPLPAQEPEKQVAAGDAEFGVSTAAVDDLAPEEGAPVTFASSPALAVEPGTGTSQVPLEPAPPESAAPSEAVPEPPPADLIAPPTEPAPVEISSAPASIVETAAEEPPATVQVANVEEQTVSSEIAPAVIAETDLATSAQVTETPREQATESLPTTPSAPAAATSDDEVMAALQTLIPSASMVEAARSLESPSNGASGSNLAAHAATPRWIAEEVTLAGEEVLLSLEKEMEAAYTAFSGQGAHSDATPQQITTPSDEASAPLPPENIEQPAVPAMAAAAGEGSQVVAAVSAPATVEHIAMESSGEVHAAPIPEVTGNGSLPTFAEVAQAANDIMEGDLMAASWKNIRDSIAGAAPKQALAKEEFREAEPVTGEHNGNSPTSSEQDAPVKLSASDPKAIANIVDSVLAELRPKIVEEIARKLADPKKD